MNRDRFVWTLVLFAAWACCPLLIAAQSEVQLCEPWQSAYAGQDAAGKHVIALWQFPPPAASQDTSAPAHPLTLHGATISPDGRFGSCLESFPGYPVEDKRHAAVAADHPALSPKGAFTIELYLRPKPEIKDYSESFLLDKKYVAHDDYQLILGAADRSGARSLTVNLGFGADSEAWHSRPFKIEPGTWYHVAFTYDGAGTGSFYLDGASWGSTLRPGRKNISPGNHPLSIGDRIGSYYHGFPGFLDQVRICQGVREFRRARMTFVSGRRSFRRMESGSPLRFAVVNLQQTPLVGASVAASLDGTGAAKLDLPVLAPGQSHTIDYPLDTRLRPDAYDLHTQLTIPGDRPYECTEDFTIRIAPRPAPDRLPVLMWGLYNAQSVLTEMPRLKEIGFTHVLGLGADEGKIRDEGKPTLAAKPEVVEETRHMLDEALANDLTIVASLSPGSYLDSDKRFQRINREGKPYEKANVCGLFPEVIAFCRNVGASVAQTYGDHPAFQAALIHTEVRSSDTQLCFHEHDRAAYRKFAGADIPPEITSRWGVSHGKLKDFPASRVIPDDHPILRCYQWFWNQGDGWNGLNTAVHQGLATAGRKDFWTFHDPAVRVPSLYGSGGSVDVLSQWTYTYPDPIRIGLATDELLAMAAGASPAQQVMKMTQIIWYRAQTAPIPEKPAASQPTSAPWERRQPLAPFITIAPMHLREALWIQIARPIRGIMYHGWESLVPTDSAGGYRFTHTQTQHELARMVREIIRPLGPTLLNVPGVRSDVALLESFASQMFAARGTYGWGRGWTADVHHVLTWAHLQPDIIYDETIVQRGLDGYRVLVLPDCDVLTRTVADKVAAFQKNGGIVVGDDHLAPALKPDILLQSYRRSGKAQEDKAALLALAAQLRKDLDTRYTRFVDTSDPDVIPYRRRAGETDYIFLTNDRREYGDYVGQHDLVMENGLPSEAVVTIHRPDGVVYDLVDTRRLEPQRDGKQLALSVRLGPCDGRLLMIAPRPIAAVLVNVPRQAALGTRVNCRIDVVDAQGRAVDGVIPLQADIVDPDGRPAEFSGYYAAVGGKIEIPIDLAVNDVRGSWTIHTRELAGGHDATAYIQVRAPQL